MGLIHRKFMRALGLVRKPKEFREPREFKEFTAGMTLKPGESASFNILPFIDRIEDPVTRAELRHAFVSGKGSVQQGPAISDGNGAFHSLIRLFADGRELAQLEMGWSAYETRD